MKFTTLRNLLLIVCLAVAPCSFGGIYSTDPSGFAATARAKIRKGMSKERVRAILGKPIAVTDAGSGEVWHYSKLHAGRVMIPFFIGGGGGEESSVTVTFNRRGVVSSVRASAVRTGGAVGR